MSLGTASFDLCNESQTEAIGQHMAQCLPKAFVACFKGQLGAGKTTLIRAMIRALGILGPIKSPTFSVVESYQSSHVIHHFDLYRLSDSQELEMMGFRDYFSSEAVCLIEWPERADALLSNCDMMVELLAEDISRRQLTLHAHTVVGQQVLTCVLRAYGELANKF